MNTDIAETPLFRDPAQPLDVRTDDLLARLTLREKAGQLNQSLMAWKLWSRDGGRIGFDRAFDEENERWGGLGALHSMLRADAWSGRTWGNGADPVFSAELVAAAQERVVAASRFGIPALITEEAGHGHQALGARLLPTHIGMAASWRPDLVEEAAAHTAAEVRARGVNLALAPGLDILRDPRWGRSEECFGEDPLLASVFVRALVRGFSSVPGLGLQLKHYAGQGAGIGGRNGSGAAIGRREAEEIHLPAARAGVEEGVASFMAAYNDIDGVPCIADEWLLTTKLRDEWGFDGVVMADMYAIDRLLRFAPDPVDAALLALRAGCDLSNMDAAFTHIETGVLDGRIPVELVDRACRRVLRLKIRLGLLDGPISYPVFRPAPAAAELVAAAPVLLENRDDLLPLPGSARLAVIGPNADDVPALLGDYVPPLRPCEGTSVLAGLRAAFGSVVHERGSDLVAPVEGGLERAAAAATGADVAVLVLGSSSARAYDDDFAENGANLVTHRRAHATAGEGYDVAEVDLPAAQRALLEAVAATGVPIVTVVVSGRPLGLTRVAELSAAVLYAWYPGPEGGTAIADILAGRREPSGRLPVSLPATSGTLPIAYNQRLETVQRYIDAEAAPAFRFGAGSGYASFALGGVSVAGDYPDLVVSAELTNTAERTGSTVVQLYGRVSAGAIVPRRAVLLGFTAATVAAGGSATVGVGLLQDALDGLGHPERGTLDLWLSLDGPGEPEAPLRVHFG